MRTAFGCMQFIRKCSIVSPPFLMDCSQFHDKGNIIAYMLTVIRYTLSNGRDLLKVCDNWEFFELVHLGLQVRILCLKLSDSRVLAQPTINMEQVDTA